MLKRAFKIAALCCAPISASAGDPCPIGFGIHDLGVPAWLDHEDVLAGLQSSKAWLGFTHHTHAQGIQISRLQPRSPMSQAGFNIDDVITAVNGIPATDIQALEAVFDTMVIGTTLTVDVAGSAARRVTVGATDPVAFGFVRASKAEDCRDPDFYRIDPAVQARVQPLMYDANRRFRCDDAHVALQSLGEPWDTTDVYVLRGSRRIIIAMPYWDTLCIQASALDGANLTDAKLLEALNTVIKGYVADRLANP